MSASPAGRRLRPVRLAEIPLRVRQDAYDKLLMTDGSKDGLLVRSSTLSERAALGLAAESPSDRVYWIPADAYEQAASKRGWKLARAKEQG